MKHEWLCITELMPSVREHRRSDPALRQFLSKLSSSILSLRLSNSCWLDVYKISMIKRESDKFDVCVTVHHQYNNINSELDATIIILLIILISVTCFRRRFRPSSGALDCVYSLWYKAPTMLPACRQQRVGRGIALLFHDRNTRRGWVVSSTSRPHFTPGKDPVPILQKAGWSPGPVWTGGKSRPHGIRSRTVQPVVCLYTDWATWPTVIKYGVENKEDHVF